jgi:hypothetical protein
LWFLSARALHLCEYETNELAEDLNGLFDRFVEIPRIRHGSKQTLDTLINEEALLFAMYLRNEKETWKPRIGCLVPSLAENKVINTAVTISH